MEKINGENCRFARVTPIIALQNIKNILKTAFFQNNFIYPKDTRKHF